MAAAARRLGATVVRAHLDQYGFSMVDVEPGHPMNATRADPDGSWVRFALAQHAPDEHLLAPLARQALRLMTALLWDLGEHPATDAGGFSRFLAGLRGEE